MAFVPHKVANPNKFDLQAMQNIVNDINRALDNAYAKIANL